MFFVLEHQVPIVFSYCNIQMFLFAIYTHFRYFLNRLASKITDYVLTEDLVEIPHQSESQGSDPYPIYLCVKT